MVIISYATSAAAGLTIFGGIPSVSGDGTTYLVFTSAYTLSLS